MAPPLLYTAAALWSISALAHIFPILAKSKLSWSPRYFPSSSRDLDVRSTRLQNSASYFLGDSNNDSLQRIYGISFPDKKQLADYKVFLAEAAKRDHRKIGKDQELFFFNDLSPGSCFFLPHGTRIYNSLVELMRVSHFISLPHVLANIFHSVRIFQTRIPRR